MLKVLIMKKLLKARNILLLIIVFLSVAQFFKIEKTNPQVTSSLDFLSIETPPENISAMVKNQCYDCHSNETKYPWYTDYAPISWWIKSNINGARDFLNFSEWGKLDQKQKIAKMEECYEAVEEGEMPVALYILMHEESQFSDSAKDSLMNWFKNFEIN